MAGSEASELRDSNAARAHFERGRQLVSSADIQLGYPTYLIPRLEEALAELRRAMALDPSCAEYRYWAGSAHWLKKEPDAALRLLREAVELDPRHVRAWARIGSIHLGRGEHEQADQAVEKGLALDPRDPDLLVDAGLLADERGDPEAARGFYERAVAERPSHAIAHFRLFDLLRGSEQDQAAAARAFAAFEHWQGLRDALVRVEQAYDLQPQDALLATDLGVLRHALGMPVAARQALERALSIDPAQPRAHLYLGKLEADAGRIGRAIEHVERALRHDPTQAEAWGERARLELATGTPEDAAEWLRRGLASAGDDADNLFLLALLQRDANQRESALETLARVIELDARHVGARLLRGEVLVHLSREREAEQDYEEVLRIEAGNEAALQSLSWLRREQDEP